MHYHCEVIMPPTDDVASAIASVMKAFDENAEDTEETSPGNTFWDFYVMGGRFAGHKLMARYDQVKIEEFHQWLRDAGVTVSGFQCGKKTLSPSSQIATVDAKWNAMFPSDKGAVPCPIFNHSNDQYGRDGKGTIDGDICTLAEACAAECERVIFAGLSWNGDAKERTGPLEATFMLCRTQWNGVNHMKVDWDGRVSTAIEKRKKHLESYGEEYRQQMTPQDDWLAVTVDYHS